MGPLSPGDAGEVPPDQKAAEEKAPLNPAQQLTYDMVTKGAGAVCPENLRPVIDWYNSVK